MKAFVSPILMSVAIAAAGFVATQTAKAADLSVGPSTGERARTVYVAPGPFAIWRKAQPLDLIYTYTPEYPGWRGDPTYYRCGSVRETLPDGTIVTRRARAC